MTQHTLKITSTLDLILVAYNKFLHFHFLLSPMQYHFIAASIHLQIEKLSYLTQSK